MVSNINLHPYIEANPDLTEGEIKKAFRKLALKLRECPTELLLAS